MAAYTQSVTTLLSHQLITHPASVIGSAINVATKLFADIYIYHSNVEVTANATGVSYRIEVTHTTSGDEDWLAVQEWITTKNASETEALTATEPSTEKVIAVASTTNLSINDIIYIQDAGTLVNSEWARIDDIVTDTSVSLVDGLTTGKDSSDFIFAEAATFHAHLPLAGIKRIRATVGHQAAATGSNIHFKAEMVTADSIG